MEENHEFEKLRQFYTKRIEIIEKRDRLLLKKRSLQRLVHNSSSLSINISNQYIDDFQINAECDGDPILFNFILISIEAMLSFIDEKIDLIDAELKDH